MLEETWKDISGYEQTYQVSNLGNVRSLKWNKVRLLSQHMRGDGYKAIWLGSYIRKAFLVHRLVATAFLDNPLRKKEVNHKNKNRTNNQAPNLEWVSPRENTLHAFYNGCSKITLSFEKAKEVRKLFALGMPAKEIAQQFQVTRFHVYRILRNIAWNEEKYAGRTPIEI